MEEALASLQSLNRRLASLTEEYRQLAAEIADDRSVARSLVECAVHDGLEPTLASLQSAEHEDGLFASGPAARHCLEVEFELDTAESSDRVPALGNRTPLPGHAPHTARLRSC